MFDHDDQKIKEEIQRIMEDCASDKAKGLSTYNTYEDQSKYEKSVEEPPIVVKQ